MRRREYLTPDITPLIDIVFLLLVFFLVTSVFKKEQMSLELTLPQAGKSHMLKTQDEVRISVTPLTITLNDILITHRLEEAISGLKKETVVTLYVDKATPYENLFGVLEALKRHEVNALQLAGERVAEKK